MTYFSVADVANIDDVLGYIATFIDGEEAWTVDLAPTTATLGALVGGREFIAHNGACLVGLRSTLTATGNPGNLQNRLMLMDGVGPYTGGGAGSLNGNSGWGAYYTNNALNSACGSSNPSDPDYNPNYNASWNNIRGIIPQSTNVINPGPYPNLYIFSNSAGDYVHVVLQIDSLNFRHMLFGNIIQYGTWDNAELGGYFAGSYWSLGGYNNPGNPNPISAPNSGEHAVPFQWGGCADGQYYDWTVSYANGRSGDTAQWINPNGSTSSWEGSGVPRRYGVGSVRGGFNRMFKNIQISTFTGLVPMGPVVISSINDTVSPNTICPVGEIPDFRMINMEYFSDGQEFAIGADTWKVFSMASKNGAAGQVSSLAAGFAYKKIS